MKTICCSEVINMDFNEDKIKNILNDISLFEEIDVNDIPCVDLYMDQVTTFFEDKLKHYKRNEDDKILTKTMINNYSKAKILPPANKKKYSKQHIILLTLIYNLKQVLSINDIKLLISPLVENFNDENNDLSFENFYSNFLELKNKELDGFNTIFESQFNEIKNKSDEYGEDLKDLVQVSLLILTLINNACIQKRIAEKLIDNFFNKE